MNFGSLEEKLKADFDAKLDAKFNTLEAKLEAMDAKQEAVRRLHRYRASIPSVGVTSEVLR